MSPLPTIFSPIQVANVENQNQNHDAEVITVAVVFSVLSICAVLLRLTSRHMKNATVEIDDLMIVFALMIGLSETIWVVVGRFLNGRSQFTY